MTELIAAVVFTAVYGTVFGSDSLAHNTPFWLPIEGLQNLTWNQARCAPRYGLTFVLGVLIVWFLILAVEVCL